MAQRGARTVVRRKRASERNPPEIFANFSLETPTHETDDAYLQVL